MAPFLLRRRDLLASASAASEAPGVVSGTALGSGRNPAAPPPPLVGLTVLLLPRSAALLDELERLRRESRDSLAAYRSAIPQMRRLVEAAIAEFTTAGRADSIRTSPVDGEGRFALGDIPSGDWILIAYRALYVDRSSRDRQKESGTFLPSGRLVGYDRVSVWLRPLAVEPGQRVVLELTDRNVWFEGVQEKTEQRDRVPDIGRRRRSAN